LGVKFILPIATSPGPVSSQTQMSLLSPHASEEHEQISRIITHKYYKNETLVKCIRRYM